MEPLLAEEEARPEFNMQTYGNKILNAIVALAPVPVIAAQAEAGAETAKAPSVPAPRLFGELIASLQPQPFEVCRLFLAALQLANNGNISILGGEPAAFSAAPVAGPGANGGRGAKAAAAIAADEEAWMFSQAVRYDAEDAAVDAQLDEARAVEEARARRQQGRGRGGEANVNAFPADGHIRVPRLGFAISLLSTRLRSEQLDSFEAPSAQEAREAAEALAGADNAGAYSNDGATLDDGGDDDEAGDGERRAQRAREAMRAVLSPTKARGARPPRPATATAPANEKRGRTLEKVAGGRASKRSTSAKAPNEAPPVATDENDGDDAPAPAPRGRRGAKPAAASEGADEVRSPTSKRAALGRAL